MLNETNCTYMRVYAHPVASVKQMCTLMFTTSVKHTHLHMHDAHNTCECIHTLRKNAYGLVHARLCHGAEASLPWKLLRTYLESCLSIVQAVVLPPALAAPSAVSTEPVARRCSQEIRLNPRYLMTRSPLRCFTSIIRSLLIFPLVFQ